jgi:hypothetical protein
MTRLILIATLLALPVAAHAQALDAPLVTTPVVSAYRPAAPAAPVDLTYMAAALAQAPPPAATPDMRLGWDQAAATLADVQSMRYTAYANGAIAGIVVTATCTGATSPFTCATPLPTPVTVIGNHTIVLAAQFPVGVGLWSDEARSAPFSFRVVALPAAPATLRLQQ